MKKTLFLLIVGVIVVFWTTVEAQTITLPWSTTYNCLEMVQGTAPWNLYPAPLCDGIRSYGAWTSNGQGEQITSAANNPSGSGGRGQRQWDCDGNNCNSGSTIVSFASPQPELYIRWYMRYQAGYTWAAGAPQYDKVLYIRDSTQTMNSIPEFYSNNWNMFSQVDSNHMIANMGWAFTQGGSVGDGVFHCFEVHIKTDTNGGNGIGEFWFEGVQKGSITNINYGRTPGWVSVEIGENQNSPANGRNAYVDFDDIAISNTGRIGCLNTTPLAPPKNLRVN